MCPLSLALAAKTRLQSSCECTNQGTAHTPRPRHHHTHGDRRVRSSSRRGLPKFWILPDLEMNEALPALCLFPSTTAGRSPLWWGHCRRSGQRLCCSQLAEVQTAMYVSCCLANVFFYKNPVNYLLFRAGTITALPCPGLISHMNLQSTLKQEPRAGRYQVLSVDKTRFQVTLKIHGACLNRAIVIQCRGL